MKAIKITTEKAIYTLPLKVVAKNRANFYLEREMRHDYQEEFDYVMEDDYAGIDWLENNMDIKEFRNDLVKIKDLDTSEDFINAEKEIIKIKK